MTLFRIFLVILALCSVNIDCARILGVYPTPSISHQVVFRALTLELVKRGHEVVAITPNLAFKNEVPPKNLTEIDISRAYGILHELFEMSSDINTFERGVIIDVLSMTKMDPGGVNRFGRDIFTYPEVKSLIADRSQKFDLVIMESLSYAALIFSKMYNAPAILFSSFYGTSDNFLTVGAVSRHPVLYPIFFRYKFRDLSIWEKLQEIRNEWDQYNFDIINEQLENDFLKSEFGNDAPTVHELKSYVELLFVNSHPIFDGNRPVPPGVVYLGALHLKPITPLPEDLQNYLDSSARGVIYVSLGTNVFPSMMHKEFLDEFLNAFEALPYDIMWKFDGDNLEKIPKNVKIQKWFPQRDLLGHPNIKLFITQGGLQSTDEAIDAELPMVGIPILGDQWFNVNKYIELGIGVEVDSRTLTADKLVKAVHRVIDDKSFRRNIAKLKGVMRDQPEKPIDRAVWWTEYVLRHGRTRHLLSPSAFITWCEYLMADVLVFIMLTSVIVILVSATVLYYCFSLVSFITKFKVKQD